MKRGTPTHSKTTRLMLALDIPRYQAVGLLESLWHLTANERPRGDIGVLSNQIIAHQIDWRGDPDKLIAALVDCGWLDASPEYRLVVHEWHLHADDAVQKRIERSGVGFANVTAVKPAPKGERGRVYFIREPASGNIKIGFTEGTPESRLAALQTAHHTKLELLGSIPGTHKTEGEWHRQFAPCALAGEWFRSSPQMLDAISRSLPAAAVVRPCLPTADRDCLPEPEPEPEPEPMPVPVPPAGETVTVEEIFAAYPRKVARSEAIRAIKAALKLIDGPTLLAKVREYATSPLVGSSPPQFIPHPATWFDQGRYHDDPAEWATPYQDRSSPNGRKFDPNAAATAQLARLKDA